MRGGLVAHRLGYMVIYQPMTGSQDLRFGLECCTIIATTPYDSQVKGEREAEMSGPYQIGHSGATSVHMSIVSNDVPWGCIDLQVNFPCARGNGFVHRFQPPPPCRLRCEIITTDSTTVLTVSREDANVFIEIDSTIQITLMCEFVNEREELSVSTLETQPFFHFRSRRTRCLLYAPRPASRARYERPVQPGYRWSRPGRASGR